MPKKIAIIGIIIENNLSAEKINELLHEYSEHIISRMGVPYRKRGLFIISVAVEAPADVISSLSGKIGRLRGVKVKTACSDYCFSDEE